MINGNKVHAGLILMLKLTPAVSLDCLFAYLMFVYLRTHFKSEVQINRICVSL